MERLIFVIIAGIVGIVVMLFLFVMIRRLQSLNREYKRYDEIDRYITYKCPKCGKVMENGFAMAGKGICYRSDEEKPLSSAQFGFRKFLKNTMNMTMSIKENVAWRCRDCNYVLIDHSYLVDSKRAT